METRLEISSLDLAKFFYKRELGVKKQAEILIDLWRKKKSYLEYYMYNNLREFSSEVDNIWIDMVFGNIILNEIDEIISIQTELEGNYSGYGLYSENNSQIESCLKQYKLRLMYDTKRDYIMLKMRTLIKDLGYKRRTKKMVTELYEELLEIGLYLCDGYGNISQGGRDHTRKFEDIGLDEYIRIYNY